MTGQVIGPLPVEAFIDAAQAQLLVRREGRTVTVPVANPLQLLIDLGLLLVGGPAAAEAPLPAAAAALRKSHDRVIENRPKSKTCEWTECGKTFPVAGAGRVPRYCSPNCKSAAARAGAKGALAGPALPSTAPPIEESGGGMRARLQAALKNGGPKGPTLLDTLREKNAAVARRSGVA